MANRVPRIGEIFIQKGWITWEQLDEALRIQNEAKKLSGQILPAKRSKNSREIFLNIGEILLNQGWIKPDHLTEALTLQQETGAILGSILRGKNFVTEKNLHQALAIQHGMSFADLEKISISPEVLRLIPKRLAYDNQFIPLVNKGNVLLIAISNPKDINAEASVKQLFPDYEILTALMTPSDLSAALVKYYGPA